MRFPATAALCCLPGLRARYRSGKSSCGSSIATGSNGSGGLRQCCRRTSSRFSSRGIVPSSRLPAEFGVDVPVLRVVFPDHVFFDTAMAALRDEAQPLVGIVSQSLRNEPLDVAMFVAGHADARGARPYNENLSIERANTIAESIYRQGVAVSTIWRIGFGEDMPLFSGRTSFALDRNRRIEFLFAARPEAIGQWLADQQLDELCRGATRAETEKCKAELNFAAGYDVIEVGPPKSKKQVDLPRKPGPVSTGRSKKSASGVAPTRKPRTAVAPVTGAEAASVRVSSESLIGATPRGSRKIRIDPRNRRIPPVRVDL